MMIPQIVGSMGLVGIAGYLIQAAVQARVVISALKTKLIGERAMVITLALSYLGVLMMSQVNPGLFCPLPYGLIATAIFAVMDGDGGFNWVMAFCKGTAERIRDKRAQKAAAATASKTEVAENEATEIVAGELEKEPN